jgi:hypothetical protein
LKGVFKNGEMQVRGIGHYTKNKGTIKGKWNGMSMAL